MALKLTSLAVALTGTAVLLATPAAAQDAKAQTGKAQAVKAQDPKSQDPRAQDSKAHETLKKYCTGDYVSYCSTFNRDDPALEQCFKSNWTKISENCRRAIDAYAPIKDVPRTNKKS